MKKLFCLILVCVLVTSLVACGNGGSKIEGKSTTMEKAIDNYVEYLTFQATKEQTKNICHPQYWEKEDFEAFWTDYRETSQQSLEIIETRFGKDYQNSYEIVDKYELDNWTANHMRQTLKERYGIDPDTVTELYYVSGKIVTKGSKDEYVQRNDMTVAKIENVWYVINLMIRKESQ